MLLASLLLAAPASATNTGPFYVAANGNDRNDGSAAHPWKTIAKVNATALPAGAQVLFRRGDVWSEALVADNAGVTYAAYGSGKPPVIDGGGTDSRPGERTPIRVTAASVIVDGLQVQHAEYAGIDLYSPDTTIRNSVITHNPTGVQQNPSAPRAVITGNVIAANNILIIRPGPDDDCGAQGVALGGADPQVTFNVFSDHWAAGSPDYGVDGAAVEVFGSRNAFIAFNTSQNDLILAELGNKATGTTIYRNTQYSMRGAAGGVNVHGGGTYGGVTGTRVVHNSIVLTAADSLPFVVDSGADVELRNNVLVGGSAWAEKPVDDAGNVWQLSGWSNLSHSVPDAKLTNPAAGDFRPRADSPAIDRAETTTVPRIGAFTGAGWDSGAVEY